MEVAFTTRPVLVTGATGFLGSHVCEVLAAAGIPVRGLTRRPGAAAALDAAGIEVAPGDVTDPDAMRAAAAGCTAIVHCAARVGSWERPEDLHAVNVEGTRNTLDAALEAGVERFVAMSTIGVYGMQDHDGTDETAPMLRSGDPYCDSKIAAEELILECQEREGLPMVVLRPGVIYGPRDRHFLPQLVTCLVDGRFQYIEGGTNRQALVYVDNVAGVVPSALSRPDAVGHAFTIAEPVPRTTRELVECISGILGIEPPTRSAPLGLARAYCTLSELAHRLLRRSDPPLVNRTSLRFSACSRHFDVRKAQELLGYAPCTDLEGNLRITLDWLRARTHGQAEELARAR